MPDFADLEHRFIQLDDLEQQVQLFIQALQNEPDNEVLPASFDAMSELLLSRLSENAGGAITAAAVYEVIQNIATSIGDQALIALVGNVCIDLLFEASIAIDEAFVPGPAGAAAGEGDPGSSPPMVRTISHHVAPDLEYRIAEYWSNRRMSANKPFQAELTEVSFNQVRALAEKEGISKVALEKMVRQANPNLAGGGGGAGGLYDPQVQANQLRITCEHILAECRELLGQLQELPAEQQVSAEEVQAFSDKIEGYVSALQAGDPNVSPSVVEPLRDGMQTALDKAAQSSAPMLGGGGGGGGAAGQ